MTDQPLIVITDSALFDLGVSVGFGAVIGAFLAVTFHQVAMQLIDKLAALFRRSQ